MKLIRRGDIWLVNFLPDGREGEAGQTHPGVVVSNNAANANAVLLMVVLGNVSRIYMTDVLLPN